MKLEIVGQRITAVRPLTAREASAEGWDDRGTKVLVLENGTRLYASQDDEGNGPGAMFGKTKTGQGFAL